MSSATEQKNGEDALANGSGEDPHATAAKLKERNAQGSDWFNQPDYPAQTNEVETPRKGALRVEETDGEQPSSTAARLKQLNNQGCEWYNSPVYPAEMPTGLEVGQTPRKTKGKRITSKEADANFRKSQTGADLLKYDELDTARIEEGVSNTSLASENGNSPRGKKITNALSENWYQVEGAPEFVAEKKSPRVQSEEGKQNAMKGQGDSENWFNPKATECPREEPLPHKVSSVEGKDIAEKSSRDSENWFNPKPEDIHHKTKGTRVQTKEGQKNASKGQVDSEDWFNPSSSPTKKEVKQNPDGTPRMGKGNKTSENWFSPSKSEGKALTPKPARMANSDGAAIAKKNSGTSGGWFKPGTSDGTPSKADDTPRGQGKKNQQSENWFSFEANKDLKPQTPKVRGNSTEAQANRQKGEKSMDGIMKRETSDVTDGSMKPKNDQPKPSPQKSSATPQKSSATPQKSSATPQKSSSRFDSTPAAAASQYAQRNRGSMDQVMNTGSSSGTSTSSPKKSVCAATAPTPDRSGATSAAKYAQRNRGTMNLVMAGEPEAAPQTSRRVASSAAMENMRRSQAGSFQIS